MGRFLLLVGLLLATSSPGAGFPRLPQEMPKSVAEVDALIARFQAIRTQYRAVCHELDLHASTLMDLALAEEKRMGQNPFSDYYRFLSAAARRLREAHGLGNLLLLKVEYADLLAQVREELINGLAAIAKAGEQVELVKKGVQKVYEETLYGDAENTGSYYHEMVATLEGTGMSWFWGREGADALPTVESAVEYLTTRAPIPLFASFLSEEWDENHPGPNQDYVDVGNAGKLTFMTEGADASYLFVSLSPEPTTRVHLYADRFRVNTPFHAVRDAKLLKLVLNGAPGKEGPLKIRYHRNRFSSDVAPRYDQAAHRLDIYWYFQWATKSSRKSVVSSPFAACLAQLEEAAARAYPSQAAP